MSNWTKDNGNYYLIIKTNVDGPSINGVIQQAIASIFGANDFNFKKIVGGYKVSFPTVYVQHPQQLQKFEQIVEKLLKENKMEIIKKSKLREIIKEELKQIKESKAEVKDLNGLITTFLSDVISKNFMKYIKSGIVEPKMKILGIASGAHRATENSVVFAIEPKDLKRRTIDVEIIVKVNVKD